MSTSAPSMAQIRADFREIGQLQTCSFKLKQWIKIVEGIVTIDYVSNLNASHNILLQIHTTISNKKTYCYQMTPPFQIQPKGKNNKCQYMIKAKNLSTNKFELIAIILKQVSISNKFYNLIVK